MSRADENGTHANDCRSKLKTAERLAESTRATFFQFSNKSVVNYIILERVMFDS